MKFLKYVWCCFDGKKAPCHINVSINSKLVTEIDIGASVEVLI